MRKSFLTVITCVLLLAMLAIPMTAFATTGDPEAQAEKEIVYDIFSVYDTEKLWGGSSSNAFQLAWGSTFMHKTELWTGNIHVHADSGTAASTLYDPTTNAMTNLEYFQWSTAGPLGSLAGEDIVAISMELKYDPADTTFDGFVIHRYDKAGGLAKVDADGNFFTYTRTPGAEEGEVITEKQPIGTLTTGWNTLSAYFIPSYTTDEPAKIAYYTVYFSMEDIGSEISMSALEAMPSYQWNITGNFAAANSTMQFGNDANNETASEKGSGKVTVRHFKAMSLLKQNPTAAFLFHEDLNVRAEEGSDVTIPTADGVVGWMLDGLCYLPGETYTMTAEDVAFTPLFTTMWNYNLGYDTSTLWTTSTDVRKPSDYWNHTSEGWTGTLWWFSNTGNTGTKTHTYNESEKSITITNSYVDGSAGSNNLDWYLHYGFASGASNRTAYSGSDSYLYSFDIHYTAGNFAGVTLKGNWNSTLLSLTSAGLVKTNSGVEAGALQDGWNSILLYFIANYDSSDAVTSYNIYCAVNPSSDSLYAKDVLVLPYSKWTLAKGIVDTTRMQFYIATAPTEANPSVSATFKNFKSGTLTPSASTCSYVDFDGKADLMSAVSGSAITLPAATDTVAWSDGTNIYNVGAEYTPTATYTLLTALTETDVAYLTLVNATDALTASTAADDIIAGLETLEEAMENQLLDTADARYTAAEEAKANAILALNDEIADALATIDPANATARYTVLASAITLYNDAKAYITPDTVTALSNAITAYNDFVAGVNADVVEATTAAVAATVAKLPSVDLVAILADIKSKVEDAE